MAEADRDGGRFQIVREIARGGMGRVVEAIDVQLGRTVALKQALDDDPEARARFAREVEITARLEHPSIVPVYDAGASPDGEPFYVMRRVSGAPLDRLLATAATLDERLAYLPNVLAVADAVAHAHARGVIHRDVKPANVLVGELGETVVIDWGLAKIVGETDADGPGAPAPASRRAAAALETTAGSVFGTPGFMAPEQVTGGATDARTDVYALGACLYAVLAGHPPLAGVPEPEILRRTVDGAVPRLPGIVAGVPPDLVTIVEKAMATAPAGRYLDAGGLGEELRRFLTGQLVASHRYGTGQRLVRWLRRHRALVAVSAIALAILIAVAVIAVARIVDERERTLAALTRERARADELIVAQALSSLDTDPTLAVATLQELRADSPRWASLAPIAAAARARGVAVGYPGHGPGSVRVAFAPGPDDARVLTAGDGTVRLHDLARRTSTVLLEDEVAFGEWAGPLIALIGRKTLPAPRVMDPVTRTQAAIDWPTELGNVHGTGAGGVVVFTDKAGAVGAVDASRGLPLPAPVALPVTIAARNVQASPTAAWVIASANDHVQLLRRAAPGAMSWTLVRDLPGDAYSFAWNADETRVLYVVKGAMVELDLAAMTEQRWPGEYAPEHLYAGGERIGLDVRAYEIHRLVDGGVVHAGERVDGGSGQSLATNGDAVIVLIDRHTIAVKRGAARQVLRPPVDVTQIAASPGGRYLVGVHSAAVIAWDLAEVLPERAVVPVGGQFAFTADDLVIAIDEIAGPTAGRTVYRYRIADRPFTVTADRLGRTYPYVGLRFVRGGIVIGAHATRAIDSVTPSVPTEIGAIAEMAGGVPGGVLVGTVAGEVYVVTPGPPAIATRVATVQSRVVGLAANAGWIAVQAIDGTILRRDPDGTVATTRLDGAWTAIAITARGTVVVGAGDRMLAWPAGEPPRVVATLAVRPVSIDAVAGDRVAVATEDGVLRLYDPARETFDAILPATTDLVLSADGRRGAARLDGAVVAVDFATAEHWTVMDRVDLGSGWLALSPDGDTLLAGETTPGAPAAIDRFDLTPPTDVRTWVLAATNARRPAQPRGAIEWRPLTASP